MLKGIPKILSPEALKTLAEMGHGDELVIADGNFPAASLARGDGPRLLRADGHGAAAILRAVMELIPLDGYADPNVMLMEVAKGDSAVPQGKPEIWGEYRSILEAKEDRGNIRIKEIERFAFYERAGRAYAVIATGENALYANIMLKKGVI
jgi:L-fucose mutarotase